MIALFLAVPQSRSLAGGTGPEVQDGIPHSLSLDEAKQIAFARNWDLLAAKCGIDSATAQFIIAKEFPNPTASLATSKLGSHEAGTPVGNSVWERSYDTVAAVSQLIEVAGKRHDRQEAARAGILGARAMFLDTKRVLDQGISKAYFAVLMAEATARNLNQSAGYLQHEAEIGREQLKAGDLSDANLKQLEVNAEQFELQAKAADAMAAQNRIAVEVLMGEKKPRGKWTPAERLEKLVTTYTAPAAAEPRPDAMRTDVLAAEANLRAGKAQLELQKAYRIPDPTFSLGYEHDPPGGGPVVNTLNVGVSFPLPLWNRNGGNIKAAEAAVDQFQIALGKIKTQAFSDFANAVVGYNEARNRFLRYRDETAPKSAKVRESVSWAYEHGAASLVDLLNAEQTDNTVRQALAQAMSDTTSAVADLIAAQTMVTEMELIPRKR